MQGPPREVHEKPDKIKMSRLQREREVESHARKMTESEWNAFCRTSFRRPNLNRSDYIAVETHSKTPGVYLTWTFVERISGKHACFLCDLEIPKGKEEPTPFPTDLKIDLIYEQIGRLVAEANRLGEKTIQLENHLSTLREDLKVKDQLCDSFHRRIAELEEALF